MHNYCIFIQMCSILTESDGGVANGDHAWPGKGNNASES